jgi:hypothetical protein
MKIFAILTVLAATLFACRLDAALEENVIREFVKKSAASQLGDPYLWVPANNGGYLFRFAADIDGDGKAEDFLGSTMKFRKTRGDWDVFSKGKFLGTVNLPCNRFTVIREGETSHLPYGISLSATEAVVFDQIVADDGVTVEERAIRPAELDSLREEWRRSGLEIQPKISALLFMDYVAGRREWKPVDLAGPDYVFHGDHHFVLKSDEARLDGARLTPEAAMQALTQDDDSKPGMKPSRSTSKQGAGAPKQPPVSVQQSNQKPMQEPIDTPAAKAAFEKILARRKGEKAEEASADLGRLFQQWNPVGRSLEEVKHVVGKPDWEKPDSLGYRFDTGWGGWEWSLFVEANKIKEIKRSGLD